MTDQPIGYRKVYKMRKLMPDRNYIVAGIPYAVIEREAAIHNLTVNEFIEKFEVVAEYDSFDGIHQTFREIQQNNDKKATE